jgi:hypothetical protein
MIDLLLHEPRNEPDCQSCPGGVGLCPLGSMVSDSKLQEPAVGKLGLQTGK